MNLPGSPSFSPKKHGVPLLRMANFTPAERNVGINPMQLES